MAFTYARSAGVPVPAFLACFRAVMNIGSSSLASVHSVSTPHISFLSFVCYGPPRHGRVRAKSLDRRDLWSCPPGDNPAAAEGLTAEFDLVAKDDLM